MERRGASQRSRKRTIYYNWEKEKRKVFEVEAGCIMIVRLRIRRKAW